MEPHLIDARAPGGYPHGIRTLSLDFSRFRTETSALDGRLRLRIEPAHWLLTVAYSWLWSDKSLRDLAIVYVVITLSLLVHELGHALTAVAFGARAEIELHGFGGATRIEPGSRLGFWRQCLIDANGPLAGLALAVISMAIALLASRTPAWSRLGLDYALAHAIQINLVWGLFNALPIEPMDGGNLLRKILHRWLGEAGLKAASAITIALASLLTALGVLVHNYLMAALTGAFAFGAYQQLARAKKRAPEDEDPTLRKEIELAGEEANGGRAEEAIKRLVALRKRCGKGELFIASTAFLARMLASQRQFGAAYPLLSSIEDDLGYDGLMLLQQLACDSGDHERALALGSRLFGERQEGYVAYVNAVALACLGRTEEALIWARSAVRMGLENPAAALAIPELEPLRGIAGFDELLRICSTPDGGAISE